MKGGGKRFLDTLSAEAANGRHDLLGEQAQGAQRLRVGKAAKAKGADEVVRASTL